MSKTQFSKPKIEFFRFSSLKYWLSTKLKSKFEKKNLKIFPKIEKNDVGIEWLIGTVKFWHHYIRNIVLTMW